MALFGSPAPQWTEQVQSAGSISRASATLAADGFTWQLATSAPSQDGYLAEEIATGIVTAFSNDEPEDDRYMPVRARVTPKNVFAYSAIPLGLTPRPNGFGWSPPFKITKTSEFTFTTDYDPEDFVPATTQTYYIDPVAGLDTNAGTDVAPFQSLFKAVHNRSANILVYAKPGLYDRTLAWKNAAAGTPSGGFNVVVRRWGSSGRIVSSMHYAGLVWTLQTGSTYKATLTGTQARVADASILNSDGDYTRLTVRTSIATVDAAAGSYWYDVATHTVYVRTPDSRVPDSNIMVYDGDTDNGHFTGGTLWIEHIDFYGGQTALNCVRAAPMYVYQTDCTFKYATLASGSTGAFFMEGGTLAISKDCVAAEGELDGFKYVASAGVVCNYAEINCVGRNNGWPIGSTNVANGSSAHDGITGVRVMGSHTNNEGREVHDIGGGGSWLCGVVAGPSRGATQQNASFGVGIAGAGDNSKMWLDSCTSYASEFDTWADVDAKIYTYNFRGLSGAHSGTGSVPDFYRARNEVLPIIPPLFVWRAGDTVSGETFTGPAGRMYFDVNGVVQTVAGANVKIDSDYLAAERALRLEGSVNQLVPRLAPTKAQLLSSTSDVTDDAARDGLGGLAKWLKFGTSLAATQSANQSFTPTASTVYTITAIVEMADGSVPVFGTGTASSDFRFIVGGSVGLLTPATTSVKRLGLTNRYRCRTLLTTSASPTANTGVQRGTGNSGKSFWVSGFTVFLGNYAGATINSTGSAPLNVGASVYSLPGFATVGAYTLYSRYYNMANANVLTESAVPYVSGAALDFATGRLWTHLALIPGTLFISQCRRSVGL
jgi:hypothetical protein